MTLTDIMIVVLLILVIGGAVIYIRREKKQGKCIGCPYAAECAAKKKASAEGSCGCQGQK